MPVAPVPAAERPTVLLEPTPVVAAEPLPESPVLIRATVVHGLWPRPAELAIEVFCYRVVKYIGAFWVVLGGADAVVFTGGIGENQAEIRQRILDGVPSLGGFTPLVVPTNEELMIARDTARLLSGKAAASKRPSE